MGFGTIGVLVTYIFIQNLLKAGQLYPIIIVVNVERDIRMPCEEDYFQCTSGQCIYKTARCDYTIQCSDGSDEAGCGLQGMVMLNLDVLKINLNSSFNLYY